MLNPAFAGSQRKTNAIPGDLTLRLIPDISAAALRSHQSKELAVWYILRSIDQAVFGGSGVIDKDYATRALVTRFGYSSRSASRHLSAGEGVFWESYFCHSHIRLSIRGLRVVCKHLGTNLETDRHFRKIPGELFNTPSKRKAQIYASCHKPASVVANPITRQSITKYTGLTKSTQRRLERIAHVRRVPHYAMQKVGDTIIPQKVEIRTRTKAYWLDKRLPNSYRTQQEPDTKGMLRSTSKRLRSLIVDEAQQLQKRYFTNIRKLTKALSSRGQGIWEGLYKVRPIERTVRGRQEWLPCTIVT